MADIKEIVDDVKTSFKKLDKKKVFAILCVIVAIFALIRLWSNKQSTETVTYVASGYDGYPIPPQTEESLMEGSGGSGGSGSDSELTEYYENLMQEQNNIFAEELNGMYSYIEDITTGYESTLSEYEKNLSDYSNALERSEEETERAETIAAMQKNSDLYWYTSGDDRAALVAENEMLGASIGATKVDGVWYDSTGAQLFENAHSAAAQNLATSNKTVSYDVNTDYQATVNRLIAGGSGGASKEVSTAVIQRAAKIAGTGAAVTYDSRVDYQAAINQAKADGAEQSVIDTLTAQRQAKIADQNKVKAGVSNAAAAVAGAVKKG